MSDDLKIINAASVIIANGVGSRHELARKLGVSRGKLNRLAAHIPNIPPLLSMSQAASLGRKTGAIKWGSNFRLKGTPVWK